MFNATECEYECFRCCVYLNILSISLGVLCVLKTFLFHSKQNTAFGCLVERERESKLQQTRRAARLLFLLLFVVC